MNVDEFRQAIDKQITLFKEDLLRLRGDRISVDVLADVKVEAYNTQNPIENIATVSVIDARTIIIKPWDSGILKELEKALLFIDLGATIQITEGAIRVIFPQLTQERRMELVKLLKQKAEATRVVVRNLRREIRREIDEFENQGGSEDKANRKRDEVEKYVTEVVEKLDKMSTVKEKELLTV